MTQGQINVQEVMTQAITGALAVSVLAGALGMLIAATETMPTTLKVPVTARGVKDLKSAYGEKVVNKAASEVGTGNIMALAAKVEEYYIADMKKRYGDWPAEQGLATAPPGDIRAANEIAAVLSSRGVTPATAPVVKEKAVVEGKRRGKRVAQPVKDTKTGTVYQSKAKAGMSVAAEYGLDSKNHFIWYEVIKKDPKRFVRI